MKHDIVEAWLWKAPGDIIEDLLARSTRLELRAVSRETKCGAEPGEASVRKDRYYTMARRARVRALLRGKL
jgi:hypothetical protein